MAVHDNRSPTLRRSEGSRRLSLRPVGQRLTNFLRGPKEAFDAAQPTHESDARDWTGEAEVLPRFPLARRGYRCGAVDAYVAELEQELAEVDRELAELRAHSVSRDEVSIEIKRVGEQTTAVLIAANEQRDEILRAAREEADRCLADARAKATLMTSEGEARLRELQAQHQGAERERDRLLDEVRNVSAALAALADSTLGGVRSPVAAPADPDG
jgi:vacuolar-type H+-ATPase subunit H